MRLVTEVCVLAVLLTVSSTVLAETVSEEAILFQVQGGSYAQDNGPMYDTFEACERSLAYQQALVKLADIPLSKDALVFARCFKIYFCVKWGIQQPLSSDGEVTLPQAVTQGRGARGLPCTP